MQWTEKYRPVSIGDVRGQEKVTTSMLKYMHSDAQLPHLLFYGPPGTGKTSLIFAYLNQRYSGNWKTRTLSLNASDERGIGMVRSKIKEFIKTRCKIQKYIILDEADSMTPDAQSALRRIIETSEFTTFCIICNYRARIIDPLQSRCCTYQFNSLPTMTVINTLMDICRTECLDVNVKEIERLVTSTNGDLRESIGRLQNLASVLRNGVGADILYDDIDLDTIRMGYSVLTESGKTMKDVQLLWDVIKRSSFSITRFMNALSDYVVHMHDSGQEKDTSVIFECLDVLSDICDCVMTKQMDPEIVLYKLLA